MDKRLLNFMLVSMIVFIIYMEFLKFMNPPKPEGEGNEAVAEQLADEVQNPAPVAEGAANSLVAEQNPNADPTEQTEVDPDTGETQPAEEVVNAENKRVTIGSLDPNSGYPFLVTFNSRGAAVERIELTESRYRDLEDKGAYIGHLGLTPMTGGAQVTVVGPGTPAAIGGIEVDDVITMIGPDPITTDESAAVALGKFKYGADVPIEFTRNGVSQSITLKSIRRPLEVVRPEYAGETDQLQQLSYLLTLHRIDKAQVAFDKDEITGLPSLRNEDWQVDVTKDGDTTIVEFTFPLSQRQLAAIGLKETAFDVVKRFSITPHLEETATRNFHFDFEIEFRNKGTNSLEVGYRIDGPTGLPLEGWWYSYKTHPTNFSGAGVRDIVWRSAEGSHTFYTNPMITKELKNEEKPLTFIDSGSPQRMKYLGVDAQYFNTTMLASSKEGAKPVVLTKADGRTLAEIDKKRSSRTPITYRADSDTLVVAPGQSINQEFEIFAGPKSPEVLAGYDLGQCIIYGWFKWPAQIMGKLLHGLHYIVGNYGISIILLTLIVRACMFPIGRQQAMNAKKMQELSPEIAKIKEKYEGDVEKQTKAQQELFKKHNYNPLAGCAPMFLQLPIFVGLYRALSVDIELRQTPLIPGMDWCANLSAPDMLFRWDNMIPFDALTGFTGYLGPYFNLLPLISTGLFLVHQQLFTPPPTDEQQEMQQKVMKFMMIFMLVIFFKVPAGLCLYFITSSLWALAERLLLPKDAGKKAEETPVSLSQAATASVGAGGNGGTSAAASAKKKRRKRNKK